MSKSKAMTEPQAWQVYLDAEKEEERILEAMKRVFENTPRRDQAEKIITEQYANNMYQAKLRSCEALRSWIGVAGEIDFVRKPNFS